MEHKTLEAKATTTDLGEFTAIAAAYSVDRVGDRIIPGAFKGTIQRWQESGKQIPLHWDHSGDAADIIGTVDPASMEETKDGLQVKGQLDLEAGGVATTAWRLMKKDAVGLSFGYLVTDSTKGKDGVTELKALDLFEVSITPAPANPDTRVLSMKALLADPEVVVLSPEAFITGTELEGAQQGLLKRVWTAQYVNALPDSAFMYVEPGGTLDAEGKTTPRLLRHFHYRDETGALDEQHLRNAQARIPQSDFSKSIKQQLSTEVDALLEKAIEDASSEEPPGEPEAKQRKAQDSLKQVSQEAALEGFSGGASRTPPPAPPEPAPAPVPRDELRELRQRSREAMLDAL